MLQRTKKFVSVLILSFCCILFTTSPGNADVISDDFLKVGYGYSRNSCATNFEEHGVYPVTLVYMIDEIQDSVFYPIDPKRNSFAYRKRVFDFYQKQFGITLDPYIEGDQVVTDENGGTAVLSPIRTSLGASTHVVYGLDAQHIPQWRNRMPITNVAFRDDGYFVFMQSDFIVHGEWGKKAGKRVRAGDVLAAGEYRMFDDKNRLLDTIEYYGDTPSTLNPFAGAEESSDGASFVNITCRVESKLFGTGVTRGIGEIRPLPDGRIYEDFRYVMRFPSQLPAKGPKHPRCRNLKPLRRHW